MKLSKDEIQIAVENNKTVSGCAKFLKIGIATLWNYIEEYNIIHSYGTRTKRVKVDENLVRTTLDKCSNFKEAYESIGISRRTLSRYLKKFNIKHPYSDQREQKVTKQEIETVLSNCSSIEELSKILNVSIRSSNYYLKKYNIKNPFHKIIDKDHLVETLNKSSNNQSVISSLEEEELIDFIKEILPNYTIQTNDNTILLEPLTIYIPELSIGIQYNNLYDISDCHEGISRNYLLTKTKECYSKNIRLINVLSDEWDLKKDIVKKKLKSILGCSDTKRIYARKCVVKEVDSSIISSFLINNHIQGSGPGTFNYGLFYNEELVAVMNFLKIKKGFKLNRFATSEHVIGGFSKLLNNFIKDKSPDYIETFADIRWSSQDSNVYKNNGFKFEYNSEPNYFYTKDCLIRESRQKYQKHKLKKLLPNYNGSESEYKNMCSNGFYRIWDCGNMKFTWSSK